MTGPGRHKGQQGDVGPWGGPRPAGRRWWLLREGIRAALEGKRVVFVHGSEAEAKRTFDDASAALRSVVEPFTRVPGSEVGKVRGGFGPDIATGAVVGVEFHRGDQVLHMVALPDALDNPEIMAELGRQAARAFREAEGE